MEIAHSGQSQCCCGNRGAICMLAKVSLCQLVAVALRSGLCVCPICDKLPSCLYRLFETSRRRRKDEEEAVDMVGVCWRLKVRIISYKVENVLFRCIMFLWYVSLVICFVFAYQLFTELLWDFRGNLYMYSMYVCGRASLSKQQFVQIYYVCDTSQRVSMITKDPYEPELKFFIWFKDLTKKPSE